MGGVERHEDVVLQQRVGAGAVVADGHVDSDERVGRTDHEREEEGAHREHDQQRPRHHRVVAAAAEPHRYRHRVAAQNQHPQQDGSLQRRPERGHVEHGRRGGRAVVGHELHAEVPGDQSPLHHCDSGHRGGGHDEGELAGGRAPARAAPSQAQRGHRYAQQGPRPVPRRQPPSRPRRCSSRPRPPRRASPEIYMTIHHIATKIHVDLMFAVPGEVGAITVARRLPRLRRCAPHSCRGCGSRCRV